MLLTKAAKPDSLYTFINLEAKAFNSVSVDADIVKDIDELATPVESNGPEFEEVEMSKGLI
jgi:hypothetical protein